MAHVNNPWVFLDDGRAYTLEVYRADPDRYHVAIVNGHGRGVLTFIGSGDELHGLFLGLHNVLVDAGQAEGGRSTLTIPGRAGEGDERGGCDGE